MTGFWGEAIGLLEKDGTTTIIAPELEAERAREESVECDVVLAERGTGLAASLAGRPATSGSAPIAKTIPR